MADACVFTMLNIKSQKLYTELNQTHINIGTGIDLTIRNLAETVQKVIGYNGTVVWDSSKPDGTYKKQQDVSLMNKLGWNYKISLNEGIKKVYSKY